ncbi:Chloramphenicol acetyltransferase-like domain-containing protein [Cynara cardunculus var. scolymus]|uniref:Chloramphenicol acetyltransferase-like domain-containing protein n=1 Tax=Cynara cardunculus var. scolymus TaxID=59895 RepID=A0A103Y2S9_CYNCS|nr:Chloramphenicol acetyltransferase-like domain-containing protein [Cynara cardunculus var. scolymus]
MKNYYHLLTLRRSKGLFSSNSRWVHQTSTAIQRQHGHRHPPPPPPLPPPSSHPHISRNTCRPINAFVSHHCLQTTRSNLTSNHYYHSQSSTLHTSQLQLPYHEDDSSPLHYHVTVKGRDVISSAKSNQRYWLPLSNLDLLLPPVEAGVFFCYRKKDRDMSSESVVNSIKRSLAGILSSFYPLAGEIVANKQGEAEVVCNNGGVEFVHAHADIELKDLDLHHPDDSVKGKLVTEFNCGAIIISCAIDHRVADAYSLNMFLVAWAKYAKSGTMSDVDIPSFRPSIFNSRRPPTYAKSLDNLYIPISSIPPPSSFDQGPLHSRMYYIHAQSIDHLQSEASSQESKRSKLLSFTAFLWKLLAHGGDDAVNTTSRMGVVVDGRRFLADEQPSSPEKNHFGNVLSVPFGVATHSDLKAMPLNEIADRVHRFVAEATNEEHFRGLIDWVELHRPKPAVARIYFGVEKSEGEAVVVSSGRDLPINDMDFGWGRPEFGSLHFPWGSRTGYISTMPSGKRIGDWVVYVHLKQKDLDLIERMAPNVFKPLTHSLAFD